MIQLTQTTIDQMESEAIALVEFSAPWCVYCKRLGPTMKMVEKEHGDIPMYECNIDDMEAYSDSHGIDTIPTLMLFTNGQTKASIVNPGSKAIIDQWLKENL